MRECSGQRAPDGPVHESCARVSGCRDLRHGKPRFRSPTGECELGPISVAGPAGRSRTGQYRRGVITNGDLDQQQRKLAQLGLTGYFDPVVASSDVGASKPEPEIFVAAAQLAGQPVERCVYVGDRMETDANAATTGGMGAVWLNRTQAEGEPGPCVKTITTLAELRI